jgi:hypothetical protein
MTTTPNPPHTGGLLARAVAADEHARRACPRSYPRRHGEWRVWARRQQLANTLAGALGLPIDTITVGDDPLRGYGINAQYPGDLLTVTDPANPGQAWRFIPDLACAHSWLLLGDCPHCAADGVPVARVAGLADLGAWQRTQPATHLPDALHPDPGHHPTCRFHRT